MIHVFTYFDIDGTLVRGIGQPTQSSDALTHLVNHLEPKTLILPASSSSTFAAVQYVHAVVTGRPFSDVVGDRLLEPYLRLCSAIISNVGTQIHLREADGTWSPCDAYTNHIRAKTNYSLDAVRAALRPLSIHLTEQDPRFNSALKLSYCAPSNWGTTEAVAKQVHAALTNANLVTAYPVVSLDPERSDYNVDVLAAGTTKRGAIEFIHPIFENKIRTLHPDAKIVVGAAGDTGNDITSAESMQQFSATKGCNTFFIMPSNATSELREALLAIPTTPTFTIFTPEGEHANGLLESLRVMEETLSTLRDCCH
jgi:hypothetical protein